MSGRLRAVAVVAVLALLLVAVATGVRWWRAAHTSDLVRALQWAPADTQRYSWTDWAGVRRELGASLGERPTADELEGFLDDAFDADLSPMSSMTSSAPSLGSLLGVSPATVRWELLAQAEDGVEVVLRLEDSVSFERLEEQLRAAGYTPPGDDSPVWQGSSVVDGQGVPPEFGQVVLDPAEHLVRASDSAAYLRGVVREDSQSDRPADDVRAVAEAVGEPLAAALYSGSWTCAHLAMSQADEDDQAQAAELVASAGKVSPVRAFAMARLPAQAPGAGVRVAMAFADHDQAVADADSRSRLAAGPAPGQGGDFADRFELGRVAADGSVVTLDLSPVDGSYVLSDLSTGPVLFATC